MDYSQYASMLGGGGGGGGGSPSSGSSAEGHIVFGPNGPGADPAVIGVIAGLALVMVIIFAILFSK
jgi:hypothetical protein